MRFKGFISSIVLVLFVFFLTPSDADGINDNSRLLIMDRNMQKLNLTDIHFKNPYDIVKVGTVANMYDPQTPKDVARLMQRKLKETAHLMTNGSTVDQNILRSAAITVPRPNARQIQAGG